MEPRGVPLQRFLPRLICRAVTQALSIHTQGNGAQLASHQRAVEYASGGTNCLYFRTFLAIGHVQQVSSCPVVVVLPLFQTISANRSSPTSVFLSGCCGTALFQTVSANRSCPTSIFLSGCCGTALFQTVSANRSCPTSIFLSGCCGTAFISDGFCQSVMSNKCLPVRLLWYCLYFTEFLATGHVFKVNLNTCPFAVVLQQVSKFLSVCCGTATSI